MPLEDQRREYIAKRETVGAHTALGHRYSTAVSHLEQKDKLERLQTKTLNEIAELELAEML